jgi:hypothetical protein
MNIFSLFPKDYKEKYKQECIDYLKKYINVSKSDIIVDLIKNVETWDNYSISVIYVHIIGTIMKSFSLKEDFMKHFLLILLKNISPDPSKRETLEETLYKYDKLFILFTDWHYIKNIPCSKMKLLYDLL